MDYNSVALKRHMHYGGDLSTKEDCIDRLKEIEAYYELDGEAFDFGTGVILNNLTLGNEFFYYKKDIRILKFIIEDWDKNHNTYDDMDIDELEACHEYWYPPIKHSKKQRENKYARNRKHKDRLIKQKEFEWYPVYQSTWNDAKYPKRYYRGKRSKMLKKQSSKIIRNHQGEFQKKGNKHKRVFDFWWELD